jgi:hypothetical protein
MVLNFLANLFQSKDHYAQIPAVEVRSTNVTDINDLWESNFEAIPVEHFTENQLNQLSNEKLDLLLKSRVRRVIVIKQMIGDKLHYALNRLLAFEWQFINTLDQPSIKYLIEASDVDPRIKSIMQGQFAFLSIKNSGMGF